MSYIVSLHLGLASWLEQARGWFLRSLQPQTGGESGDPKSPHFNDQATRYSTGDLREVYFYRPQLEGHIERQYHPGH